MKSRPVLGLLLITTFNLFSAELIKVSDRPAIPQSIGLEMNYGQSRSDVLFLHRSIRANFAVTPQAVLFSPVNTQLKIVGGESNPSVTYGNTIQNAVNVYHGADESKWLTGIPVHGWARLNNVYPGISLEYKPNDAGLLVMKWIIQPEANPDQILLDFENALSITAGGGLSARFLDPQTGPELKIERLQIIQKNGDQITHRNFAFKLITTTRFGFTIEGRDPSLPLEIELSLPGSSEGQARVQKTDSNRNTYIAETLGDAAGVNSPFKVPGNLGCGIRNFQPDSCRDVVLTKYSPDGILLFRSYLIGSFGESVNDFQFRKDGSIAITGHVNSPDFPVSLNAYQRKNAGPSPFFETSGYGSVLADVFVTTINHLSGHLLQSTFFGGSGKDSLNQLSIGEDNSAYLFSNEGSHELPTSAGAFQATCPELCRNGYIARLSADLDQLVFATYLPGSIRKISIQPDGTVYFGGYADPGFPTTPDAYQKTTTRRTGFLARLRPDGQELIFGTYYVRASDEGVIDFAVLPDESIWAMTTIQGPYSVQHTLIRISENGKVLLHEVEVPYVISLSTDKNGDLLSISESNAAVSPVTADSLLNHSCNAGVFTRRNLNGEVIFSTYLPAHHRFAGISDTNNLLLHDFYGDLFLLDEKQERTTPFAGCVVDGARFIEDQILTPGELVSLFGKHMGPEEGVAFELVNDKLPTTLGGTQVLVNGEPAPLLYVSATQINMALPFSLKTSAYPVIQVVTTPERTGNIVRSYRVWPTSLRIFQTFEEFPLAIALNQDGSVNSRRNPATPGSIISLFGTGGGQTTPASKEGEVTPLAPASFGIECICSHIRCLHHTSAGNSLCRWSSRTGHRGQPDQYSDSHGYT